MEKSKYYAVRNGRVPGIYTSWSVCKAQVDGYSGAQYKSFSTEEEARQYLSGRIPTKSGTKKSGISVPKTPYAFVDGSFNPVTGVYGYGGFLIAHQKKYLIAGNGCDEDMSAMRNVAGEITGAMKAVEKAMELGLQELTILYDYMGIEQWATGKWQTNKPGTQAYAVFMKSCPIRLKFQKVAAHTGIPGNETADAIAKCMAGIALTAKQQELALEYLSL